MEYSDFSRVTAHQKVFTLFIHSKYAHVVGVNRNAGYNDLT